MITTLYGSRGQLASVMLVVLCSTTLITNAKLNENNLPDGGLKNLLRNRNLYKYLSKHVQSQSNSNTINNQQLHKVPPIMVKDVSYLPNTYRANPIVEINEDRPLTLADNANMVSVNSPDYSPLANEYDNNDDYYQNVDNGYYYAVDGQDAWFDEPVTPKVSPLTNDDPDGQLNKLLINYLYDQYYKFLEDDDSDQSETSNNMEKRRQKIIIRDDKGEQTTTSAKQTSTTSMPEENKAKILNKSVKLVHHGQKEVPLLRPAESKHRQEWPSELDDSSLSEEESLKELSAKSQSRPVRDVLTSQLDSLKAESTSTTSPMTKDLASNGAVDSGKSTH